MSASSTIPSVTDSTFQTALHALFVVIIFFVLRLQVMDYHREYYRPENLSLIITGKIEPEEVLQALEKFEDKILSKVIE